MRRVLALCLAFAALFALPVERASEPASTLKGTLVFDESLNETLNLSMEFLWIDVDGRNVSADEIRASRDTGEWHNLSAKITKKGKELFNETLEKFHSVSTSIYVNMAGLSRSGPLFLYMNGTGRLRTDDPELPALLGDCGLSMTIHLSEENISLNISVPDGWSINGNSEYLWEGDEEEITIRSPEPERNRVDVLLDIYRIDTSGEQQNLYMNISVNASVVEIPATEEVLKKLPEGFSISCASISLINHLIDESELSREDFLNRTDEYVDEMVENIILNFPGVSQIERHIDLGSESVEIDIGAIASAPVDYFENQAFLRWYASQRVNLRLSGLYRSVVNYTVMIPEGMKILSISHGDVPVFYRDFGERSGFFLSIDDYSDHIISVSIGFVIDLNPLIPLFIALFASLILWAFVARYVPRRRGKHG